MSKELTPFQALTEIAYVYGFDKNIEIIDNALEENEKLKECYKNELKNTSYYNNLALKYKKVLEIIKNKKVDVKELLGFFEWENGFSYYNEYRCEEEKLTQEEYELLKEILK